MQWVDEKHHLNTVSSIRKVYPCLVIYKALLKLGTMYALESNMEQNLSYNPICMTITRKPFLILPVLSILVPVSLTKKKKVLQKYRIHYRTIVFLKGVQISLISSP